MNSRCIGVFVIVVNSKKEILLGERKNCYKAGWHGFPGGRLELDESIEDCARRELLEETGLKAKSLRYVGVIRERQDGYNFVHFGFICDKYEGYPELIEPDKCGGWDFYSQDSVPARTLAGHLAGIQLLNGIKTDLVDIL